MNQYDTVTKDVNATNNRIKALQAGLQLRNYIRRRKFVSSLLTCVYVDGIRSLMYAESRVYAGLADAGATRSGIEPSQTERRVRQASTAVNNGSASARASTRLNAPDHRRRYT